MQAGDCFLQPPHIRHRVLESSDNMEVVEFACPAEHETCVDHDMPLPTPVLNPDRDFSGQRFVYHNASDAAWLPWKVPGFEYQDTGIAEATNGIASAVVVKASADSENMPLRHDADIRFLFVLQGAATIRGGKEYKQLLVNSSCAIPADTACQITDTSADFKMLEVFVPSR
jgi:mannose-6-phosphate isomerase-like protein (cupin superfamily)